MAFESANNFFSIKAYPILGLPGIAVRFVSAATVFEDSGMRVWKSIWVGKGTENVFEGLCKNIFCYIIKSK